jgi:hypothetical protein
VITYSCASGLPDGRRASRGRNCMASPYAAGLAAGVTAPPTWPADRLDGRQAAHDLLHHVIACRGTAALLPSPWPAPAFR